MKKTLQEIKNEVAKKHLYLNWNELYCNLSYSDFIKIEDEAAELYIYQKNSPSKEEPVLGLDEAIEKMLSGIQFYTKGSKDETVQRFRDIINQFKSSKEGELQKEIEQLHQKAAKLHSLKMSLLESPLKAFLPKREMSTHDKILFAIHEMQHCKLVGYDQAIEVGKSLEQTNKELLEALKLTFRYISSSNNPVAYALIRDLIQKHSNPPSTVNEKEEQIPISHMIDVLTVYGHFPYEESLHELIEDFPKRWNIKRLETCHWYQTIGVEIIKEITRKEQI
jgi:uncharacterized protein YPO0396